MSEGTHVHIATSSRDCDGGHGNYYVVAQTLSDYFGWYHMPYTGNGPGTFEMRCDEEGMTTLYFSAATDEGYTSTEIRECADDCDTGESSQYDQYAEMAGY